MIEAIDVPTEQTTAATNAVLALLALLCLLYLRRIKQYDIWKVNIWSWVFGLLALSAALGTLVHGFKMPRLLYCFLWQPLFLTLGFTVALFILGALYDTYGSIVVHRMFWVIPIMAIIFYATALIYQTFLVFVIYEIIAMTFALIAYSWLALRKQLRGAGLMIIGILITIIAAGFQAKEGTSVRLMWEFDNNGIFHLIQMAGIIFLMAGLRAGLLSGEKRGQNKGGRV